MSTDRDILELSAGDMTEELAAFITESLSDEEIDQIEVARSFKREENLVAEPVTIAVTMTIAPLLTYVVLRIIERYMETKKQEHHIELLAALPVERQAAVLELAKAHANVMIKFGAPKFPRVAGAGATTQAKKD